MKITENNEIELQPTETVEFKVMVNGREIVDIGKMIWPGAVCGPPVVVPLTERWRISIRFIREEIK